MKESQISSQIQYNKILLPDALPFIRMLVTSTGRAVVGDGSGLQFLVEEFIALGAIEVAVDACSSISNVVGQLPRAYKKRVIIVNKREKVSKKLKGFLNPIADEFDLKFCPPNSMSGNRKTPEKVLTAAYGLQRSLYWFLMALDYKLQVDVDLTSMKNDIGTLRQLSRNPDSRANLAVLSGILETYNPITYSSLSLHSTAPSQLVQVFQEFAQDEAYREISAQAHLLGFPAHARKAVVNIGRLSREFVTKSPFKQIVNLSSKLISAATSLPLPDADSVASLVRDAYLPPIIPLKKAIQKAKETWEEVNPSFIPLKDFQDMEMTEYKALDCKIEESNDKRRT
jgi:hypothetical protein